jgi:hypothetical protein
MLFSNEDFTRACPRDPDELVSATTLQLHMRPSNIWIRRNMTTAEWIDIFEKLKARNLSAFHRATTIPRTWCSSRTRWSTRRR